MTIFGHIQQADLGGDVTLYQLDLTMFGQGIIRIAPGTEGASAVSFGGEVYAPLPVEAKGFAVSASGPLPRPTITVANLDNAFTALVSQNDDLLGAILTRIRTYTRYLDGQPDADGGAHLPLDVYELASKRVHTAEKISWQCKALMDQDGKALPGRIVTRDYCDHTYRQPDGAGGFIYEGATCPYGGTAYFDKDDQPSSAANDQCSKRLTGCRARFGNAPLPFRGFPGVARLRVR